MDRTSIYQKLHTLTDEELYFQKCCRQNRIPRLPYDISTPYTLTESMLFPKNSRQNVLAMKHACFSPSQTHNHDFFEIFYVLEGQSQHEISGKHSQMKRGDFCMISPETMHYIHVPDESIIIDILVRKSAIEKVFSSLLSNNNILSSFFVGNTYTAGANDYIIFHTGNDEDLQKLVLDMYLECETQDSYYEMLLDTQLAMLFGKLLRHYENTCELPPFTNKSDSRVFGMIQYLHKNYQEVSLTSLAQKFHYTPEYTSKLIHDATGRTFSALLTQIRMEQATRLLQNTTLTIADIGMQIGYTTPEHFIRTFKKAYHKTPSEYRKKSISSFSQPKN